MQNYWKEITVELPEKIEYDYIVKNENANCIIVRNSHISSVLVGAKPRVYEIAIPPNQVGVISRPFPIESIHLVADAKTPVTIIETITQDPTNDYIQQNIARYVSVIDTVGLTAVELNRDAMKNVGVNVHNQPLRVCQQAALEPLMVHRVSTAAALDATLDTGIYGRPVVNIYVESSLAADFWVDVSNDGVTYFRRTTISVAAGATSFTSFNDNAFRFIRVATTTAANNVIAISATR